jgi:hypothetical protein
MKLYKLLFALCLFITLSLSAVDVVKPVQLTHPMLKTIDGIRSLMDKDNIYKSILTGQMLRIFMDGGNPDNIPLKEIEYKGKKYTMRSLLIHTYQGKECSLRDLMHKEEQARTADEKRQLQEKLDELKSKYEVMLSLILKEARGTKKAMEKLIEESCRKRNRPDSLLINWGQVAEGKEQESMQRDVTSHKIFYIFCGDLINFLKDLVFSCPKARKQYEDWKNQQTYKA